MKLNRFSLTPNFSAERFVELERRFSRSRVFGRILQMMQEAGCQTVIEETNPPESECRAENEIITRRYQARRRPVRLHFFKDRVNRVEQVKNFDARYLGY